VVTVSLDGHYYSLVIRCAQIVVLHYGFIKMASVFLEGIHLSLLKNILLICLEV